MSEKVNRAYYNYIDESYELDIDTLVRPNLQNNLQDPSIVFTDDPNLREKSYPQKTMEPKEPINPTIINRNPNINPRTPKEPILPQDNNPSVVFANDPKWQGNVVSQTPKEPILPQDNNSSVVFANDPKRQGNVVPKTPKEPINSVRFENNSKSSSMPDKSIRNNYSGLSAILKLAGEDISHHAGEMLDATQHDNNSER